LNFIHSTGHLGADGKVKLNAEVDVAGGSNGSLNVEVSIGQPRKVGVLDKSGNSLGAKAVGTDSDRTLARDAERSQDVANVSLVQKTANVLVSARSEVVNT
jgi:hypothetical protein